MLFAGEHTTPSATARLCRRPEPSCSRFCTRTETTLATTCDACTIWQWISDRPETPQLAHVAPIHGRFVSKHSEECRQPSLGGISPALPRDRNFGHQSPQLPTRLGTAGQELRLYAAICPGSPWPRQPSGA